MPDEGTDDEDGNIGPPLHAIACGGGTRTFLGRLGSRALPVTLWSSDEETQCVVGFACTHEVSRAVLYAKLEAQSGPGLADFPGVAVERSTKGAITTLLDVAEALKVRKITLGLSPDHAGWAELVCCLLYVGFQVAPTRKSPLIGAALLLDFDIAYPSQGGSDNTCTGTSDCSTSAEDELALDSSPDSD